MKHFFQMRVDPDFLRRVDDARRNEPDLPTRSEMARRLLEEAITARVDAARWQKEAGGRARRAKA